MSDNAAVATSLSDLLSDLGGIPANRVRQEPAAGWATLDDVIRTNSNGSLCELVDGTLVEKAMGWQESLIASVLIEFLGTFSRRHNLGVVTGPDGLVRLFPGLVRGPDVAFFSWQRLPNGIVTDEPIPSIVPDLAIEVLSVSNTRSEMARKCREYFLAGVRQVWMVDPRQRTVAVYTTSTNYQIHDEDEVLTAADILPGLQIPLADVFGELDRQPPRDA